MTKPDYTMDDMKKRLLSQQEELYRLEELSKDAAKPVELDQSSLGRLSRMDAMQMQALAKDSEARRKQQLQRIESALKRIDQDTYGKCVRCSQTIGSARLDFDPAILLCINCAK